MATNADQWTWRQRCISAVSSPVLFGPTSLYLACPTSWHTFCSYCHRSSCASSSLTDKLATSWSARMAWWHNKCLVISNYTCYFSVSFLVNFGVSRCSELYLEQLADLEKLSRPNSRFKGERLWWGNSKQRLTRGSVPKQLKILST